MPEIANFEAVRGGAGIGVLHDFMAGNDNTLIPVLPDESTLSRSYWIVRHESLKNSRRVQVVVEFLTQAVKASADWF